MGYVRVVHTTETEDDGQWKNEIQLVNSKSRDLRVAEVHLFIYRAYTCSQPERP